MKKLLIVFLFITTILSAEIEFISDKLKNIVSILIGKIKKE